MARAAISVCLSVLLICTLSEDQLCRSTGPLVIRDRRSGIRNNRVGRIGQNSILPWNAIMRGELSPPSPTPSSPVGGEMVLVNAPKPV